METFTDHAVDVGWYEHHDIPGKFTTLKRYGRIPAPETLSEFIEVAERISSASDQGITGWRGQSSGQWGVQTGAARRVLQPWSTRESRSLRYVQDTIAKFGVDTGYDYKRDQPRDEGCFGHREDVAAYQRYLLDQARRRGFDFVEGRRLSDLSLLGLLQHHGAATNLLDISSSVIVALWFAASSRPGETGVVIAFDEQPMQHIPARVAEEKSLEEIMSELEPARHRGGVGRWTPYAPTSRVLGQHSQFLLPPTGEEPWGTVPLWGTCVWNSDREEFSLDHQYPDVFFIAVPPHSKMRCGKLVGMGSLVSTRHLSTPTLEGFPKLTVLSRQSPCLPRECDDTSTVDTRQVVRGFLCGR